MMLRRTFGVSGAGPMTREYEQKCYAGIRCTPLVSRPWLAA